MPTQLPPPEFSRTFRLTELSRRAKEVEIAANEQEMTALAQRFRLQAINSLSATLSLERDALGASSSTVVVQGTVDAQIVQLCAATLQPFDTAVTRQFRTKIRESAGEEDVMGGGVSGWGANGELVDADEDWDEEVTAGGVVDLGEIAAQYMALSIDPFAKAPGHVAKNASPP